MGMVEQLHLVNDDYSNASSAFFIAVLVFSFPNMWLLNRLPVAKWLGINLIFWGLVGCFQAPKASKLLQVHKASLTLNILVFGLSCSFEQLHRFGHSSGVEWYI
jgi:fucose permease